VLLNLFVNSKDALIQKAIATPKIKICAYDYEENYVITIEDNALGIEDSLLPKIFDLYFTTKKDGSGVGLHISKIIIEKHFEGKLKVENTKSGVRFTIILNK